MSIASKNKSSQEIELNDKASQEDMISNHLIRHGNISSAEAFDLYGITRLSAVIFKLRKRNWKIITMNENGKNRYGRKVNYGRYYLGV